MEPTKNHAPQVLAPPPPQSDKLSESPGASEAPAAAEAAAEPAADRPMISPQLTVLVVDDEKEICKFLEEFLTQEGYKVRTISDSTQAIEALREGEYHVCILDLMMPKLSGMDLLGQIRKADDDIAIIIFTGQPTLETAQVGIEHEVSAYISKPFDTDEFREVLSRIAKKKGLVLRREDELHQTIGRHIREERKSRGLTLKQMSRRTNLSVSLLSQIERAESSASVASLFKVATALDVRITALFGEF